MKTPMVTRALLGVALFLPAIAFDGAARAADYPDKTISWIAAFGAGGGTDRWARILSASAHDVLGQAIRVRNMPGASGVVAWKYVLEQPADGYTVYHGSSTPVLGLLSEAKPPFGPEKLKVVAYVSSFGSILIAPKGKEWSDWDSFKAYARKNPGKLSVGGTLSLLLGVAVVADAEGIKVTYVPYPSTGEATSNFVGGHISALVGTTSTALTLVPEKGVVVLNASDLALPDDAAKKLGNPPLASALGYKAALSFPNLVGVHPDTPDAVADALSARIGELLKQKSVVQLIKDIGEDIIFVPRAKAQADYDKLVGGMRKGLALLR